MFGCKILINNDKKTTICVLLYGDFHSIAKKCISSIVDNIDKNLYELRVGINEGCKEIFDYVNSVKKIDKIYTSEKNIGKCPMMRKMFKNINTRYIWWFDDDIVITQKDALEYRTQMLEQLSETVVLLGRKRYIYENSGRLKSFSPTINEWISKQKWFNRKPEPCGKTEYIEGFFEKYLLKNKKWVFPTGPNWFVKTAFIKEIDFPPIGLKKLEDVIMGSAIRQMGFSFKNISFYGLKKINIKSRRKNIKNKDIYI